MSKHYIMHLRGSMKSSTLALEKELAHMRSEVSYIRNQVSELRELVYSCMRNDDATNLVQPVTESSQTKTPRKKSIKSKAETSLFGTYSGRVYLSIVNRQPGVYDDNFNIILREGRLYISNSDREAMVEVYCESNGLIDRSLKCVYIDDTLYELVKDDPKMCFAIAESSTIGGPRRINNERGTYKKTIASSLRRLDKEFL